MWLAWFCVDTCIYLYINTALYHSDRDYSTLLLLWIGFFHDSWGRMQVIGTPSNRPAARQDWNKCQSTRSSKILVDSDPILHDLLCYNLDIHDIYVFLNSLSMTGSTTMYLYIYTSTGLQMLQPAFSKAPGSRFDFHFAILCEVLCQQIRNSDWELMDGWKRWGMMLISKAAKNHGFDLA